MYKEPQRQIEWKPIISKVLWKEQIIIAKLWTAKSYFSKYVSTFGYINIHVKYVNVPPFTYTHNKKLIFMKTWLRPWNTCLLVKNVYFNRLTAESFKNNSWYTSKLVFIRNSSHKIFYHFTMNVHSPPAKFRVFKTVFDIYRQHPYNFLNVYLHNRSNPDTFYNFISGIFIFLAAWVN